MKRLPLAVPVLVCVLTAASWLLDQSTAPPESKLQVTLWARQPMLKNPVAISHDPMGRLYVTEANRRKSADLDVREMPGLAPLPWPALDYSIQSVEQRRDVIHRYLATDSPFNNPWLVDYDRDGRKNWEDLRAKTERINLLEDTDGDGRADKANVFAEGFNTEVTGTAGGVLWFDDRVYFTLIPDLWLLEDDNRDGIADQRTPLITGHGVHIGQGGHDLHGLTVGPDGRIYWSVGDKGVNITSQEGRRFFYPNQGAIMRSEPDGSNFEVFAHGLRNCQELAFDDFGNLFCVDNDGDFKGERERLVYVTRHSDTGWRINWQFNHIDEWAETQGLPNYNPWMEEQLFVPHFQGQAAYITPALANYADGPAGFARNPGTALSDAYADYYFLTQFPGKKITAFQLVPKGAAFEMVNEHLFEKGFMATGLSFGPDGALYVADWAGDWVPTEEGGIFKIDVQPPEANMLRATTESLIRHGMAVQSVDSLIQLLTYPDQRVRLNAQFELVKREVAQSLILTAFDPSARQLGRVHSLWGLGQLARTGSLLSPPDVETLFDDPDPEIRIQTIRFISDAPALFTTLEPALIELLQDDNLRVQFHTAQTLGVLGTSHSIQPLFDLLAGASGKDPFIRHGIVTGLAGIGAVARLTAASAHSSNSVRMGALLALRRLKSAEIVAFLHDTDPLIVLEAARAIHDDFGIPEALPALAALIDQTPHISNEALMRRILNANLRLGDAEHAEAVLGFIQSGAGGEEMQKEAMAILLSWSTPPPIDRVERRYRFLPARNPSLMQDLLESVKPSLLSAANANGRMLRLLDHYGVSLDAGDLQRRLADRSHTASERVEVFKLLMAQPRQRKQAFATAFDSDVPLLHRTALETLAIQNERSAVKRIKAMLADEVHAKIRQHAIGVLGQLTGKDAQKFMRSLVGQLTRGQIHEAEQLDVFLAAEKMGHFAADLDVIRTASRPGVDAPFVFSRFGGDATQGMRIFLQHPVAQCIRCHAVDDQEGSNVGPHLAGIGGRFDRDYLLESLVEPGKTLAEGFENDASVSVMPPMGDLLSPSELRDVIAYLAGL